MSEIRTLQVAGSGTISNENVSFIRSEDRERRERLEQANQTPTDLTPQQRLGAMYGELHLREQTARNAEDAAAIARGSLIIHPDGSRTEYFSGLKRR